MHVMVLGLRGFPGVQGGIETHAEHLYPRLRDLGCDVEVVVRSPYWSKTLAAGPMVEGIRFRPLWCPRINGIEAFFHTFAGVLYAAATRPDVLHIHAIGPALFTPLAKLLGLRVVMTHHGPDYDREKWNRIAKGVLKAGERLGVRYADARIVISDVIGNIVRNKYGRDAVRIPNGVEIPHRRQSAGTLERFGLEAGRYVLNVSRLVPEKRHLDLIRAFSEARLDGWKLALVGDLDADTPYIRNVVGAARQSTGVVLTGFQTGPALGELFANAGLFALPSTHEGLPIALLEALSYGLPAIASDIPANKEVELPPEQYFHAGDVADFSACLARIAGCKRPADYGRRLRSRVKERYDWDRIARETLNVYSRVCGLVGT